MSSFSQRYRQLRHSFGVYGVAHDLRLHPVRVGVAQRRPHLSRRLFQHLRHGRVDETQFATGRRQQRR